MIKPGEYVLEDTASIKRIEDIPKPTIIERSRDYPHRKCPQCSRSAYRDKRKLRVLHDLGNSRADQPIDIHLKYSQHFCSHCKKYFNADMSDLALPGSSYTHRVISMAMRLLFEDGLPYRAVSWHLWRDHRVFVPFATVQNWSEAAGEKRAAARHG